MKKLFSIIAILFLGVGLFGYAESSGSVDKNVQIEKSCPCSIDVAVDNTSASMEIEYEAYYVSKDAENVAFSYKYVPFVELVEDPAADVVESNYDRWYSTIDNPPNLHGAIERDAYGILS